MTLDEGQAVIGATSTDPPPAQTGLAYAPRASSVRDTGGSAGQAIQRPERHNDGVHRHPPVAFSGSSLDTASPAG